MKLPPWLVRGLQQGWCTGLDLLKVMIPCYLFVAFLKQTFLMKELSHWLHPVMGCFGLPGESATALVLGNLVGIYAGLGAVSALGMSPREVTIIGVMLGLSHGLVTEGAILYKMGVPATRIILLRFVTSLLAGWFLHQWFL